MCTYFSATAQLGRRVGSAVFTFECKLPCNGDRNPLRRDVRTWYKRALRHFMSERLQTLPDAAPVHWHDDRQHGPPNTSNEQHGDVHTVLIVAKDKRLCQCQSNYSAAHLKLCWL